MTTRWILVAAVATGCSAKESCDIIGEYAGEYAGDLEGELAASITESTDIDGEAVADFVLSGADGGEDVYANGIVDCSTGSLVVDLRDVDGNSMGEVSGTLEEGSGSGDWSLVSGETGTWSYGG